MLDSKEKTILKSKLLDAFEWVAYYQELRYTLSSQDTRPCTKETAQAEYKTWWTTFTTLDTLVSSLCPKGQEAYQWLGLTNKDKEVAIAKAHKAVKWYIEEDSEEIPF